MRLIVGVKEETPLEDEELLQVAEAAEEKRRHDAACEVCFYAGETLAQCAYNKTAWRDKQYANPDLWCISPCAKYKTYTEQRRIARLLGQTGMGERFHGRTFETFRVSRATKHAYDSSVAFCDAYEAGNPRGLMLCGSYGTGKTHLAAAIVRRMAEQGVVALFLSVPELFAKIRASFDSKETSAETLIEAAKAAPVLVLDDLGAEKTSAWTQEQLYRVINHRYEHLLPVVVTTNNMGKGLEASAGARNLSRLAEMTGVPVVIQAEDWRMKGAS